MDNRIKSYVKQLEKEVKENIGKTFNTQKEPFTDFSPFHFVNFHLIYEYIVNDKKKNHFFIEIPNKEYIHKSDFLKCVFHSLVLIKLHQNYFNYKDVKPDLKRGDLIYNHKEQRVCSVICQTQEVLKLKYNFSKQNEKGLEKIVSNGIIYTKLNSELTNGRNTKQYLKEYSKFLKDFLGADFPFITDFKNRTLVIAEKSFFEQNNSLPIRYINKNGGMAKNLPFFNFLVECCNDFESAEDYLLDKGARFDEIIVIGASKYLDEFDNLLQGKGRDKYKNIILIGTEKPTGENEFTEWLYANDELKIANNETINRPQKIALQNQKLHDSYLALKKEIDDIREQHEVNLGFMLKYTHFYLRTILVNTELSKGIFKEYLDRLIGYWQSEKFEEELKDSFYDRNIYDSDEIQNITENIFDKFTDISNVLENNNLKWNHIKEKAEKEHLYLIVAKQHYDVIQNQLSNERMNHKVTLISDKGIDNEKLDIDKWLNDEKNSKHKTVIIPYLNNEDLYIKLKSIQGTCEVLCYKDIDEIMFDKIEQSYFKEEKEKLTHKDRTAFIKILFTYENEPTKQSLDALFDFDLAMINENKCSCVYGDLPQETCRYEVTFSDGLIETFDSSKGVFILEKNQPIKATIGEVPDGATIRFYKNNSPKAFKKILKIFDTDNLLGIFDHYAKSWKETLKKLEKRYGGKESLYEELFSANHKIHYNTFENYYREKCDTRFPRTKTLEAIRKICVNNDLNEELIVKEFDEFKIYARRDRSIRQQAGKILGHDLLDYVAPNKTEISDSLKNIDKTILNQLIDNVQEKKVIKKELLDE